MRLQRYAVVVLLIILAAFPIAACDRAGSRPTPDPVNTGPVAQNVDVDESKAPGADDNGPGPLGAANTSLRTDQVRTRFIRDGSVTAGKIAYVAVTVNVNAAAATGSSAANPALVGGILIACTPSGNQDQFLDNAVLNGDGSITATLAANATAQNNFRCVAVKANAQGVI